MNKLYFLIGGVSGCVSGFLLARRYYTQVKEEELARQKEYYESKFVKSTDEETTEDEAKEDEEDQSPGEKLKEKIQARKDVEEIIREHEYRMSEKEKVEAPAETFDEPYVISPEEYEDGTLYKEVNLTWYERDQVLTRDEWNEGEYESEVITDIEGTVGTDWVDRFGEFEEDTVYVRDPGMRIDYIIEREETAYEID